MNLFKAMTDMKDMVAAAPGLIESAQQYQAHAQTLAAAAPTMGSGQAYVNAVNTQTFGEPTSEALAPIAGVTLDTYARIVKGIAPFGYDQARLPEVAAAHGVAAGDWLVAQEGWSARIQADRAVGSRFNQLYTAG